ncbi:glutamine synthetase family protein [Paraburkholderia sp. D1E]|uniref:glutamine synthetase family protein n=1 Tax=Paraburkholderia sp. D1E TaxID=3461398 RepID=UPI004045EE3D
MDISAVKSIEDVRALIAERNPLNVTVGLCDMPGQIRGKCISRDKFLKVIENGICFPAAILSLDVGDAPRPLPEVTDSPDANFGDQVCRLIPESVRVIPWEPESRNLFFLVDFEEKDEPVSPRNVYRRIEKKAAQMGFLPIHSCEYEFTLFNESSHSVREKGFRKLELATHDKSYNLMLRQGVQSEFYNELLDCLATMDIPVEAVHEEMGAGFMEAALAHAVGVRAADNAAVFKTFAKIVAQRRGQMMTFMARWSNDADGQSGHVHVSLRRTDGSPAFHDPSQPNAMSQEMRYFIGGVQRLLPEFLLVLGPNVNSFRRFQPWIFSPIASTWGWENRTCALRAIGGSPSAQRIECRVPGADTNPYLALAGILGMGLWGIENKIEPASEMLGNVYERMHEVAPEHRFPTSFGEAIRRFERSEVAREIFGSRFVDAYAASKLAQEEEFAALVTDVEIRRFFEFA